MAHRTGYKKRAGFGNVAENRILRAAEKTIDRRRRRSELFATNREIVPDDQAIAVASSTVRDEGRLDQENNKENRRTKMLRWKAERDRQKNIQKQMKQPAFRVGVCHHKLDSPIFLHQSFPVAKVTKPLTPTPRITRATVKRLAAKSASSKPDKSRKFATPASATSKRHPEIVVSQPSFAPENHVFRGPGGLPSLRLFGREALEPRKSLDCKTIFSPYAPSRTKSQQSSKKVAQPDLVTIKSEEKSTSENNVALTPAHFRNITDVEVMRLKALCWDWMMVMSDSKTPEEARLMINQAIGQTNLLIDKKIKQFKKLISDAENGSGEKLVTCTDLQGFWEMMYFQVQDCDSRFQKLIELQANNWEEEVNKEKVMVKKKAAKKPAAAKKQASLKVSSLRHAIRAARQKMADPQTDKTIPTIVSNESTKACGEPAQLAVVQFQGGFFMVASPRKAVTPRSLRKSTLPQQPQFSIDPEQRRSALSSIKVSRLFKTAEVALEVETDPTISYINFQQTPGRSILKRTDPTKPTSSIKKSLNKVNFSKHLDEGEYCNISFHEDPSADLQNNEPESSLEVKKRLDFLNIDTEDLDLDVLETKTEEITASEILPNHENKVERIAPEDIPKSPETKGDKLSASPVLKENAVKALKAKRKIPKLVPSECDTQTSIPNSQTNETNKDNTPHRKKRNMLKPEDLLKENYKPDSPEFKEQRRSTRRSVKFTESPAVRRRSLRIQNAKGSSS